MYMTNDIVAEPTGPSFKEPRVEPVARRAELATIVTLVNERRRGMKRLGEFSIAPARHDNDQMYFAQIRATPSSGFGGCEFRSNLPARDFGQEEPSKIADRILTAARVFNTLTGIGKYIRLNRQIVDEVIEPARTGLHPMKVVAMGLVLDGYSDTSKVCVDFETMGRDLSVGIDRVVAHDIDDLEDSLRRYVTRHVRRAELKTLAMASRAVGWIDEAALRILDGSGLPRAEAIERLRREECIEFNFGGEDGYDLAAALYWEDGVIRGDIENFRERWSFEGDRLKLLECPLPETVLMAWPGRSFGAVAEHAFVPRDAIVTSVDHGNGDWTYIDMVTGMIPVDADSGLPRGDARIQ